MNQPLQRAFVRPVGIHRIEADETQPAQRAAAGFIERKCVDERRPAGHAEIFGDQWLRVAQAAGLPAFEIERAKLEAGIPVATLASLAKLTNSAGEARRIGFPVLIKASAGGGGKGMRVVESGDKFKDALEGAKREAKASFADDHVLIEKYLTRPRHIEIQVFADGHGECIYLFERDCSIQRRHQKVIEETPSAKVSPALRARMTKAAAESWRPISVM